MNKRQTKKHDFRIEIEQIDNLASLFNWEVIDKKGEDYRVYERGNLRLKITNVDPFGYKVMRYKDGELVMSDTSSHKDMALVLIGEALSFEKWW